MCSYEKRCIETPEYKERLDGLKRWMGYQSFKPRQYEVLDNLCNGKDVLCIQPTGYGKNMIIQLYALLHNLPVIVIMPTISLMVDQKLILDRLNFESCCYNSQCSVEEKKLIEENMLNNTYRIIFTTPESFINKINLFKQIYQTVGISLIAIDEAHCVSSYGFDFRPQYRDLSCIKDFFNGPILAATATATPEVAQDIINVLGFKNHVEVITSFKRDNLEIIVREKTFQSIDLIVKDIKNIDGSSITYCLTRKDTNDMAEQLNQRGLIVAAYHSGLKDSVRTKIQTKFIENKIKHIVATIAFGMGINKPDVRLVNHIEIPQNLESYYQEIGRAGRDGKAAQCIMYCNKNFRVQLFLINKIQDETYRGVRQKMLGVMNRYISSKECRMNFILKYFGQQESTPCMNCSNCHFNNKREIIIEKKSDINDLIILDLLIEMKNKRISYGISTLNLILKGSKSKKLKPFLLNLDNYGKFNNKKIDIKQLINKNIESGFIELYEVESLIYCLRITPTGETQRALH